MTAIIIDDDANARSILQTYLSEVSAITEIHCFASCSPALQWMQNNTPDYVFMETIIEGCSTMSIAAGIKAQHPGCKIVFCTSFPYFALDAFQIHASGYMLKPITAERMQIELDHLCGYTSTYLLTAHCFGNFEVIAHNKPLPFKRSKTKELLALLIDRNGAGISSKQICTYLWESDQQKHINYLYQLFDDLRQTLKQVGAEAVLVKNGTNYAVDTNLIDCDYYNYLKTGKPTFYGEYMTQYSWAESSCAYLWQNSPNREVFNSASV